jgi:hypothetical protein
VGVKVETVEAYFKLHTSQVKRKKEYNKERKKADK